MGGTAMIKVPLLFATCHWSYPTKPSWGSLLKSFFRGKTCPNPHSMVNACPGVLLVIWPDGRLASFGRGIPSRWPGLRWLPLFLVM